MNKNSILKITEKLKSNNGFFLLAGIVALIVQGIIITHNLSGWLDIRYADESMYLGMDCISLTKSPIHHGDQSTLFGIFF